jgi:hypothetical protein
VIVLGSSMNSFMDDETAKFTDRLGEITMAAIYAVAAFAFALFAWRRVVSPLRDAAAFASVALAVAVVINDLESVGHGSINILAICAAL